MGWRTCWLMLIALAAASAAAAAEKSLPCQAVVWASDGGKWSVGGMGEVFCTCDSSESHVADLHLLLRGQRLHTDIVNSTTVRYTERNVTESVQDEFECWVEEVPLQSVKVTVFAVLHVEDLSCRFHGAEQLKCSFSRAEGRDFWDVTKYRLNASTGVPGTSRCMEESDNPARMQCVLQTVGWAKNLKSQNLTLTMTSERGGGTQTQKFELPTLKMKVPEWPSDTVNFTWIDKLRCLSWTNEQTLVHEQLEWLVELRPRQPGIPAQNLTLPGSKKTDQRVLTFCFPVPPQANQTFDVRLRVRIDEPGAIWSEYYPEFPIYTNASVPARPPQFLPDGFSYKEHEGSRELTVFWFQLDELEHNGPNLTYAALWDGRQEADRYGSSYATFKNWDPTRPGNVSVRSRNSEGFSVNSSWLLVPAMSDVAKRQSTILEYHPATFRLAWDKPEDDSLLRGYNVYWCNASDILGQFCKDGASIHHISLDDGDRSEYTFPSSMALMDMAVSANYSDHVSGGMNLRLVGDEAKLKEQAFQYKLARVLEVISALLLLGMVGMVVKKLRKMADIKVELPDMGVRPSKSTERPASVILGMNERMAKDAFNNIQNNNSNDRMCIELRMFGSNGGGIVSEAGENRIGVAESASESGYISMGKGNTIGSDGYFNPQSISINHGDINPPPPRSSPNNDSYVMPSPSRLIPNIDGYINSPSPRLSPNNDGDVMPPPQSIPNNDGYVMAPPPRLSPNNDGGVMPPPTRFIPDNDGYINPPPPQSIPNNDGYVMAPPPRLSPNNDGGVMPPPPRFIPNNDGYINPPSPRLSRNNNGDINPPPPQSIPNNDGYVMAPPPRLSPNNDGGVMPPPPRFIPNNDGYINPPSPRLSRNNNGDINPPPPQSIPNNDGYVMAPPPRLSPNNDGGVMPPPPRFIPNNDGYINPPSPRLSRNNNGDINPPPPQSIPNNDGYVMAPPPRLSPNNDGGVMPPPPRFIPNNDGYINPPSPRLSRNNNGDINPPPPQSIPNNDGYVMAPPPRLSPNNDGGVMPPPPRFIPNNDGYINPPSPRLSRNNNGDINPPPPQSIPNNDGYVMPPPPRFIPNNDGYINPPSPRLNPNNDGYVMAPPPRLSPNNDRRLCDDKIQATHAFSRRASH